MHKQLKRRNAATPSTPIRALVAAMACLMVCGQALAGAVDEVFVSSFEDGEPCPACPGAWQVLKWPTRVTYATCSVTRIYGIVAGDHFQVTTCVPPGDTDFGSGDPAITQVTDNLGTDYSSFAPNDDCTPEVLPQLTGWSCANTDGATRMACAPADDEGIQVSQGANYLDVTICPVDSEIGNSSLHILWQGSSTPNPG